MDIERVIILTGFLLILIFGAKTAGAIPPEYPFMTAEYAGVTMTSAVANGSDHAILIGKVTSLATDPQGWFIIGPTSGGYSYYTPKLTPNASGHFKIDIYGIPIMPGRTYYVRACTENGRSSNELSFTMAAVSAAPTTTYGVYWDEIQMSNKTPMTIMGILPKPIVAALSGHEGTTTTTRGGWALFYTMILGLTAISFWLRQNETVPTIIMLLLVIISAGCTTMVVLDGDFTALVYGFGVLSVAGILYYLMKRR